MTGVMLGTVPIASADSRMAVPAEAMMLLAQSLFESPAVTARRRTTQANVANPGLGG